MRARSTCQRQPPGRVSRWTPDQGAEAEEDAQTISVTHTRRLTRFGNDVKVCLPVFLAPARFGSRRLAFQEKVWPNGHGAGQEFTVGHARVYPDLRNVASDLRVIKLGAPSSPTCGRCADPASPTPRGWPGSAISSPTPLRRGWFGCALRPVLRGSSGSRIDSHRVSPSGDAMARPRPQSAWPGSTKRRERPSPHRSRWVPFVCDAVDGFNGERSCGGDGLPWIV